MSPYRRTVSTVITQRRAAAVLGLACSAGLIAVSLNLSPAVADTETCVGRAEFDNTVAGLTPLQIANRYDIYGSYVDDGEWRFRRDYRTCWAPAERRVIVEFSYANNTSVDWYVRDV